MASKPARWEPRKGFHCTAYGLGCLCASPHRHRHPRAVKCRRRSSTAEFALQVPYTKVESAAEPGSNVECQLLAKSNDRSKSSMVSGQRPKMGVLRGFSPS